MHCMLSHTSVALHMFSNLSAQECQPGGTLSLTYMYLTIATSGTMSTATGDTKSWAAHLVQALC